MTLLFRPPPIPAIQITREQVNQFTFGPIDLYDMLMDRIVKIRLFPCYANLVGRHILQSHLWRRRDIETEFFHQDIVGCLTDLPGPIQQPISFFFNHQWGGVQITNTDNNIFPRNIPDQRPQNANRQKQSHDAPNPHRRNHARVGVKGEVQRLIHSRVEYPWTREGVRKTKIQRKKHRVDPNPVPHAVVEESTRRGG